jgi:hypothetical protein
MTGPERKEMAEWLDVLCSPETSEEMRDVAASALLDFPAEAVSVAVAQRVAREVA